MNSFITIRPAKLEDITEICDVMTHSINELCAPTYNHDLKVLEPWLGNVKPEKFKAWIENQDDIVIVATTPDDVIHGVGMLRADGTIHLCYVSPEAIGHGIGKAILAHLEEQAIALGIKELNLNSTLNAKAFYESQGFISLGKGECYGEDNAFRMVKEIVVSS